MSPASTVLALTRTKGAIVVTLIRGTARKRITQDSRVTCNEKSRSVSTGRRGLEPGRRTKKGPEKTATGRPCQQTRSSTYPGKHTPLLPPPPAPAPCLPLLWKQHHPLSSLRREKVQEQAHLSYQQQRQHWPAHEPSRQPCAAPSLPYSGLQLLCPQHLELTKERS